MYKTIRMLPALLLLLGTACTNDPADNPAATGLPLVLEHVYIGTPTKVDPYEPGFTDGSTLTATLTLDDVTSTVTSTGTYKFNGTTWETTTPAYWQNTKEKHTVTLRTTPEPENDMPEEGFTTANWHEYDILTYTDNNVDPGTTSFQLTHTRAQFCVTLKKGKGLTSAELATAKVSVNGTGMLRHLNSAHYALIKPDSEITSVEIDINGSTYTYTPDADTDIPLTAGTCTILTLALNKVEVESFDVTSNGDWQDMTVTSTEDDTWTIRNSTGGDLDLSGIDDNVKLLITGTLTSKDIETINAAKNQITHLYIMAGAKDNDESIWEALNMQESTSLQSVCITEATAIGDNAFYRCKQLTNVSLPKVESTGDEAFEGCEKLTNVSLPKVESTGDEAFRMCNALTSISLPNATSINDYVFLECSNLTNINLPKATSIGKQAFQGCKITSISLPKATDINYMIFYNCTSLTNISMPNARNFTGSQTFYNCKNLTSISLPEATNVVWFAFQKCTSLTSISLPKATSIDDEAFDDCTKLTSISLPKDTSIGKQAFDDCTSLTTLFISTPDATEDDAVTLANKIPTLTAIHYGYTGGEDGDYLDKSNYTKVWERDTNP